MGRNILILSVFFVLSLIGIIHHEVWSDEAHHFLLARDNNSLPDLIKACHIEGHPLLWNIILFFITRISTNVFYMQLMHILINCITGYIICKSSLSLWEKIFILFGYFLFYEYNIISRNYGLSSLLIFALVYQYLKNATDLIKLAVLIFILANTHLFSLLVSVAFVITYMLTIKKEDLVQQNNRTIIIAIAIILSGWLISVYTIIPPINYGNKFISYDSSGYLSIARIFKIISVCFKGIFYIPYYNAPGHHFENSFYFLTLNLKTWTIYLLSIVAIIIPILIIRKDRFARIFFCSFLLVFTPVYFFLPLVYSIRYYGFFYIVFVACYWIARPKIPKILIGVSSLIFLLQFINGIYAYCMDLYYPFSEAKNICNYIKEVKRPDESVFILDGTLRPGISVYSGEKYFGIENGEPSSYCLWDASLSDSLIKVKLNNALTLSQSSIIVANSTITNLIDTSKVVKLTSFYNGIVNGENADIYRYKK
jgi:hypothetical protein